ncbi:MAG: hypothetical protein IRZ31_03285 [Thermogemmatispora sp.]|uniref:hypothetical protein n=1 Tax=Thermogemmatispora sp. TaxID=1968838 RepID=UPI002631CB0E|nr:hypothetical protein [Thermogemmatispora sp.]MBX5455901.1 hypothetical protein [Thermogemmatispora sp.]
MSGYLNSDGSLLIGGLNPTGLGQALQLDAQGNLKTTATLNAAAEQNVNLNQLNGVAPQADGAGANRLGVSLYGKNSAPGDTPILLDSAGRQIVNINSLPALPSGSNLIGQVRLADGNGSNLLAIDGNGRLQLVPNQTINVAQIGGIAPGLDSSNELRVSNYGKSSSAGDTPILLDSAGRTQVNIAQWNGAAPSVSNPVFVRQQFNEWLGNGQGYSVTTGKQTSTATATTGLSLFNPSSSGKTLLVFSARVAEAASSWHQLNLTSSDPALGTTLTPLNLKAGGPASVASASMSNNNLTPVGSQIDTLLLVSNTTIDFLSNGTLIILPPGNGLALYVATSSNSWAAVLKWLEI